MTHELHTDQLLTLWAEVARRARLGIQAGVVRLHGQAIRARWAWLTGGSTGSVGVISGRAFLSITANYVIVDKKIILFLMHVQSIIWIF